MKAKYILKIKYRNREDDSIRQRKEHLQDPEEPGDFKEPRGTKEDSVDGAGRTGGPS